MIGSKDDLKVKVESDEESEKTVTEDNLENNL